MLDAIEKDILARLKQALPAWRIVSGADADMARQQPTSAAPLLFLTFGGLEVGDSAGKGAVQRVTLTFTCVVAARASVDPQRGRAAQGAVLSLVDDVFKAMSSYRPENASTPLTLTGVGRTEYEPPVCYLPIDFACEAVLRVA